MIDRTKKVFSLVGQLVKSASQQIPNSEASSRPPQKVLPAPISVGKIIHRYDDALVSAFKRSQDTVESTCIFPAGTRLYRGGECNIGHAFAIRKGNIFLSSKIKYAEYYMNFWRNYQYSYIYCAILRKEIFVAKVSYMKDVVQIARQVYRHANISDYAWQRDNMIGLACQALGRRVGGIYMPGDDNSDEILVDNGSDILDIDWMKIQRRPTHAAESRR